MLTTDGVAIADTGMRRIRGGNVESWVTRQAGAHIAEPNAFSRSPLAGDSSPRIARKRASTLCIDRGGRGRGRFREAGSAPSPPPHSLIPSSLARRRRALTLVELLAVIAIIGILAAITFGIARGVQGRAGIGKARVEIAAIAQALESYRVKYGDYPQTSSAATMLQCLIGRRGPTGVALTDKPLIELARFSTVNDSDPFTATTAVLMDPFGKGYHYAYKTSGSWQNPSFVLYSGGPDGAIEGALPADGFLTSAFETAFNTGSRTGNPDNIYHGRN